MPFIEIRAVKNGRKMDNGLITMHKTNAMVEDYLRFNNIENFYSHDFDLKKRGSYSLIAKKFKVSNTFVMYAVKKEARKQNYSLVALENNGYTTIRFGHSCYRGDKL